MSINLRGGGSCCCSKIKDSCSKIKDSCSKIKATRNTNLELEEYIKKMKLNAEELNKLINDHYNIPQKEIMNQLCTYNTKLQQSFIRTNNNYLIVKYERDIYEILLNILTCLKCCIQQSRIENHQLINFCLDLFYIIYYIQLKNENSFINDKQYQQYNQVINELQNTVNENLQYEILLIEKTFQEVRRQSQRGLKLDVNKELYLSTQKFEIQQFFKKNQQLLLDVNFESENVSIKDFELYCFYQQIKWVIIQEVENNSTNNIDIPKKILEYTFNQHLLNFQSFIFQKFWIQIIFELIVKANFGIITDERDKRNQEKFQILSQILMESYLKFYAQIKIKDDNLENFKIDSNRQAMQLLQQLIENLDNVIKKINNLIVQFKNQQEQQQKLLDQLKKEYFEFLYISNEIYQSVEAEKIKLKDRIQLINKEDEMSIDMQEYFQQIHQSNLQLKNFIIAIENLEINNDQQINYDLIIIFPNSINFIIDQIKKKQDIQEFKYLSQIYLKQLQQKQKLKEQELEIKYPIKSAISIASVRFNDGFLDQKEIFNYNLNLPHELKTLDDLKSLYKEYIYNELVLKYKRKYISTRKEMLKQCINPLQEINIKQEITLNEIVRSQYLQINNVLLNSNLEILKMDITQLKVKFKQDVELIKNSSISNDLKNNFEKHIKSVVLKIDEIIVKDSKPNFDEFKNLIDEFCNSNQDVNIKFNNQYVFEDWNNFNRNFKQLEQKYKTEIKILNNNISLIITQKKILSDFIYNITHQDDQIKKEQLEKKACEDVNNSQQLHNLNDINIINHVNDNSVEYIINNNLNIFTLCSAIKKDQNQQRDNSKNYIKEKINREVYKVLEENLPKVNENLNKNAEDYMVSKIVKIQIFDKIKHRNDQVEELTKSHLFRILKELFEDISKKKEEIIELSKNAQNSLYDINLLIITLKDIVNKKIQKMNKEVDNQENDRYNSLLQEMQQFIKTIEEQQNQQAQKQKVKVNEQQLTKYQECILNYKQEQLKRQYHLDNCQYQINPIYVYQRFNIIKYDQNLKIQEEIMQKNQTNQNDQECFEELNEFLQNTVGCCGVLLIFGQQGSGKSRELRNVQDVLWKKYESNSSQWIPIFISILSYSKGNEFIKIKLAQIFNNNEDFLNEFKAAVNSKKEKVLFLLDDIDYEQREELQKNIIKDFGFDQQLIGKTIKFILSARSKLKEYQNYQFYFTDYKLNFITEIELLPFNDEQKLKYFKLNHQISIKKILFKYFIQNNNNKDDIQKFESIWNGLEQMIQQHTQSQQQLQDDYLMNEKRQQEDFKRAIAESQIIEQNENQSEIYTKIVQEISKLRSSRNYLKIIKNHHCDHLTQTPFQLEIFTLMLPKLRKQYTQFYFKEQFTKQYPKLQQKYFQFFSQMRNNITGSQNLALLERQTDINLETLLFELERQQFFSRYQYFNILKECTEGIQMEGSEYRLQYPKIVIEALRANNLTIFDIIQIYVTKLNKKYTKTLENEIQSYEFDYDLQQVEKYCENLAIRIAETNQQQQIQKEELYYNPSLIIKQENQYTFKYRIIQDYYVAKFLYNILKEINIEKILESQLMKFNLTCYNYDGGLKILRDPLRKIDNIREKLIKIIKMSQDNNYIRISSNCMYLISVLNFHLRAEDLQNINLADTNISGINFSYSNLSGSKFRNVIINKCNFDFAQLDNVKWSEMQTLQISKLDQNDYVEQVVFSPDGKYMVSLSSFFCIIWNSETLMEIKKIDNPNKKNHYVSAAISNSIQSVYYIAIYSDDGKLEIRNIENWQGYEYQITATAQSALYFTPNGKMICFIDNEGYFRCRRNDSSANSYDKQIGKENIILNSYLPNNQINKLAFDKTSTYFLFKIENKLSLFELMNEQQEPISQIEADEFVVSPDGSKLAIAIKEQVVLYDWNINNLSQVKTINFQNQIFSLLSYNLNKEIVIQFQYDLALWSQTEESLKSIFKGYSNTQLYCINPQNNVIAQWSDTRKNISLWNFNENNLNQKDQIFDDKILKAEFSKTNGQLIILELKSKIIIWDCINDELINILMEETQFNFSPNGNYLVTQSSQDGLILYDSSDIYQLQRISIITDIYSYEKIFYKSDQKILAALTFNGELLKIWKFFQSQDRIQNLNCDFDQIINSEFGDVICIAISPSGFQLSCIWSKYNRSIYIYEKVENEWIKRNELNGHELQIVSIEYHVNGELLASRSLDNSIKVWFLKQNLSSIDLPIKSNPNLLDNQHVCTWILNQQLILAANEGDKIILWKILDSNYDILIKRNDQQTYQRSELVADKCNNQECLQVLFSPCGKLIAASYFNSLYQSNQERQLDQKCELTIVILDWMMKTEKKRFQINSLYLQRVNFYQDSYYIIYLTYLDYDNNNNILIFDPIQTNEENQIIKINLGFNTRFNYVVISHQTKRILAIRKNQDYINHVILYDFKQLKPPYSNSSQQQIQPIILDYIQIAYGMPITFSPDGQYLAYHCRQSIQIKKIYNVEFPTEIRYLGSQYDWVSAISVKFQHDESLLGFCKINHKFIRSNKNNRETQEINADILNFDIQSGSCYNNIIACGGRGIVKIINISNLNNLNLVQQIDNLQNINNVFFSENGQFLLIQEDDFIIQLFQKQNEQYQRLYQIDYRMQIQNFSFSSNDNDFIILKKGGEILLYNLTDRMIQQKSNNNQAQIQTRILYRLKTISQNYVVSSLKCQIKQAEIKTNTNSLKQLFIYYGATNE